MMAGAPPTGMGPHDFHGCPEAVRVLRGQWAYAEKQSGQLIGWMTHGGHGEAGLGKIRGLNWWFSDSNDQQEGYEAMLSRVALIDSHAKASIQP
jgi:hypothetical protein